MTGVFETNGETQTADIGRALASELQPGAIVLISGDLGAGKTAFVRGMAAGLGIDPQVVCSPTFSLVHEYRGGRVRLQHVDLYRLETPEVEGLGLDELANGEVITAVEWPDRLPRSLGPATAVHIAHGDGDRRTIRIERQDD
ncbi:MAG: tRNA (adenosine(37)-N6)-threonylcarbamoyltransferase complex ATPase subunit type 1 TsaE [Vicinamibacterales bacterium]